MVGNSKYSKAWEQRSNEVFRKCLGIFLGG